MMWIMTFWVVHSWSDAMLAGVGPRIAAQAAVVGAFDDVAGGVDALGTQRMEHQQGLVGRDEVVVAAVEQHEGRCRGVHVADGVGGGDGGGVIQNRFRGAGAEDVLGSEIARGVVDLLGGGVEAGGDPGQVGGSELVDDCLHPAALAQVSAGVELPEAVGGAGHRGEVAAGGLARYRHLARVDVVLGGVRAGSGSRTSRRRHRLCR
jgi:hypothetical protein